MRHWNGLAISCQASSADGSMVFVSSSVIDVRYLSNVRITDAGGDSPAPVKQESYAFFVEPSGPAGCTKTLSCAVDANPMPSSYKWIVGGTREVGQSREVTLGSDFVGQSVQCAARTSPSEPFVYSLPVQFQKYVDPRVASIAFADFRSSSLVHEGDIVAMSCRFSGVPKPTVAWHYRYSYGEVSYAKCETEEEVSASGGGLFEFKNYTSTCHVTMKNAAYSGQYWCSVCSQLSNSTQHCANEDGREMLSVKVLARTAYQRPGHSAVNDYAETAFELSTIVPLIFAMAAVLLLVLLAAYALCCRHKPVQPPLAVKDGLVNSALLPSSKSSQCSNSPNGSRSPGNDSYDDSTEARYATADEIKAFLRGDIKRSTTSVRPALHHTESRRSIMV
ncbi:Protein IGCM-3 b [Aphelenchoides avenae]|nr:Protein IGCM-3 b [Aphelenchus avenae]